MNYYFGYAIRCVIRRIIYFLTKPKYLLIILTSIVVIFLLSNYTSVFGWEGNNDYTDKNQTIITQYESICNDLIGRMQQDSDSLLDSYLKNANYSYYVYYGSADGSSMISTSQFNTQFLYIAIYQTNNRSIVGTAYDTYQGMTTNIYRVTDTYDLMRYNGNTFEVPPATNGQYIPNCLLNYHSSAITNYYNSSVSSASSDIVGAINNQTNSINQQTNTIQQQTTVIQETQDFITDDTIDSSEMSVDSNYSVDDTGVDTYYSGFLQNIYNIFSSVGTGVTTITIPLPHNMPDLVLRSDIISRYIVNTPIYLLIQTFWTFLFGSYLIKYIRRIIQWLSSGKMVEEGVFSFGEWLDVHNEIIKAYML